MALTVACNCSAIGALGRLLTEETGSAPRSFDDDSIRHEFIYESVGSDRGLQKSRAINGYLAPLSSTVRNKSYVPQGALALQASPAELTTWIPRIFGTPTGSEYISNDLIPFDILVYRENGIFQYTDAVVAQAVLRGKTSENAQDIEFFDLIIQIIGKQELIDGDADTWPDPEPGLSVTSDYLPYTFWESDLELNGEVIEYEAFSMIINNMIDFRLNNKQYPSCIRSTGREISMEIQAPFTCESLAEAISLNEAAGVGTFTLTTTGMHTEFDFRALRNRFVTPTIPGRVNVPQKFYLEAYSRSTTEGSVLIDHDDTP